MVKALSFKGDTKAKHKKRKRSPSPSSTEVSNKLNNKFDKNDAVHDDDDTTWVLPDRPSDISGPVIIIFPKPLSNNKDDEATKENKIFCLASDVRGVVFASPVENIISVDQPESAEPHDVRQVWIGSKIGPVSSNLKKQMEKDDQLIGKGQIGNQESCLFSLKASHGTYLSFIPDNKSKTDMEQESSQKVEEENDNNNETRKRQLMGGTLADIARELSTKDGPSIPSHEVEDEEAGGTVKSGRLRAESEAIGAGETFIISTSPTSNNRNRYKIQTAGKGFLSASFSNKSTIILADSSDDGESQSLEVIIKMQARFLPRHNIKKAEKAYESISRVQIEKDARVKSGSLTDDQITKLKKARREGRYNEEILDVRAKGRGDKFA